MTTISRRIDRQGEFVHVVEGREDISFCNVFVLPPVQGETEPKVATCPLCLARIRALSEQLKQEFALLPVAA